MNSATATAPIAKMTETGVKKMQKQTNKRKKQALVPTFAGQFGGSKSQSEHRAVGNQSVFQFMDPFITH